jgi:methylmalonyl-CoA mutase
MTKAVAAGLPKMRIEEAAARRQARIERGEDTIVGVNKYTSDTTEAVELLEVDNAAVRKAQLARLGRLRASRDDAALAAALSDLRAAARGENNLLAAAIEAMRARATVGEVSDALESVFTRHSAEIRAVTGVYGGAFGGDEAFAAVQAQADAFAAAAGRRPRILVAKLGQDGHDRGAKVIATGFADLGFDVDIGPLFQTPAEVARQAVEADVHIVGVSTQAAGHKTLVPQLIEALQAQGAGEVMVIVGGVVPPGDYAMLKSVGVAAIFGPGTPVHEAAAQILGLLAQKRAAA